MSVPPKLKSPLMKAFFSAVTVSSLLHLGLYYFEYKFALTSGFNPLERPVVPFIVNILSLLPVFFLSMVFIPRVVLALSFGFVISVVLFGAHLSKIKFRGDGLSPRDFLLYKEALSIASPYINLWTLSAGICVFLVVVGLLLNFSKFSVSGSGRARLLGMAVIFSTPTAALIFVSDLKLAPLFSFFGYNFSRFNPYVSLASNGLIGDLASRLLVSLPRSPDGYSKEAVSKVLDRMNLSSGGLGENRPDVIVYLMEAHTDPEILGVIANRPVVPEFQKNRAGVERGTVITPAFGGSTNNTEFSLLTGSSLLDLRTYAFPFAFYVLRDLPALPRFFSDMGYSTNAIHQNYDWYYNRQVAYPRLGFHNYIHGGKFSGSKKFGHSASDENLLEEIFKLHSSPHPVFSYALTIEAHSPYIWSKDIDRGLRVKNNLDPADRETLNAYVNILNHTDEVLGKLITHFERSKKPTIILAFGDHTPGLGHIYNSLSPGNLEFEWGTRSTTPFLVWSNFKKSSCGDIRIPSMGLAGRLIECIGGTPPAYLKGAFEAAKAYQAREEDFLGEGLVKTWDEVVDFSFSQKSETERDFLMLQYDMTYGRAHMIEILKDPRVAAQ